MNAVTHWFGHRLIFIIAIALAGPRASASFSSLHVFGDGVCTTTDNQSGASFYYGHRYCNGRVWVEVLAQWQGITYDPATNLSYFGHDSDELVANTEDFTAPADVGSALFVIWSSNADFVEFTNIDSPPYSGSDISTWTDFIEETISNHETAVTTLYNKGARTIVMPNAVDITSVPFYAMAESDRLFIRQRVIEFNEAFETSTEGWITSLPGLVIHRPDMFSFFEEVLLDPTAYDLVNPGIDAATDLLDPDLDGPGASYVFWDPFHPTAKLQIHLAELAQRLLSPLRIDRMSRTDGIVELQLANIPLGRQGYVDGSVTIQGWQQKALVLEPFDGGSASPSVSIPSSDPRHFYRLRFPVEWSWP